MVQQLLARRGDRRYAVPSPRDPLPAIPSADDLWTGFVRTLEPVEFHAGQVIFRQGMGTDVLHVISSGRTKTCRISDEGRKLLLDFHGPRDVLAAPTLFDPDSGQDRDTTVAITDVRAGLISRAALLQWIVMRPEIADHLLGVLARAQDETHQRWFDMMRIDTPGRLAQALLRLTRRFHAGAPGAAPVIEGFTQDELAQYIGSRRDTVNKMLSEFARRGWISVERKRITLTGVGQLAKRVRSGTTSPLCAETQAGWFLSGVPR